MKREERVEQLLARDRELMAMLKDAPRPIKCGTFCASVSRSNRR